MNEKLFQGFFQGLSALRMHQTCGYGALDAGMDLGGAHEQIAGHGCIRPLAFTQCDELQKDIDVLGFKIHGRFIFAIRE